MANIQIPNLTAAISLNGTEQLEAVQSGTSVRVTSAQIAALAGNVSTILTIGTTPVSGATNGYVLYNNNGVLDAQPSGGTLANLTAGTHLSGGPYNGSSPVTLSTDATNANTASTIVARDASGNFSAGTITASLTGTASTATNIASGSANQIPYQTGSGATSFITAPTVSSTFLQWTGSAFTWASGGGGGSGTVNSGTANQLAYYASTGTAVSGNTNATISSGALTLGTAGSVAGSVVLSGSTSGTTTVKANATAGTWTLTLPSSAGTNGYVLSTDGTGNTSWIATSGGGGTVTSINVSGGTTGLTTSGGPITGSGTITIGGTLGVSNGGTGVTASSGASSVVLRDANVNTSVNVLYTGCTNVAAAGTTTTLTAASTASYVVTGSGGQTYKLPDATTLPVGATFSFNNNQSSGTVVVQNNSSTTISTVQSGSYVVLTLLTNSVAAGTWDTHYQVPSNVSWSTNTLSWSGTITNSTWNGVAVGTLYGGTGLTSFTSGGAVYATSTSVLTTGTLPITAGGTGQSSALTQYGVVYGSSTTAMGNTAAGTTGQVLIATTSAAPSWGQVSLTAGVTGTLPIANGGTGITSFGTGVQTALGQNVTGSGGIALATSPSFTTPSLGVATATSLAINGATIGTNGLAVTGTAAVSSTLTSAAHTVTSASANALTAGANGSTNPAFNVDASTASSATGLNIKSAAATGGLAVSVTSSGANENLTLDAKGSGTITVGGTSTGAITLTRATTMSNALTYGGVTLSNSVTGTGSMVLSTSPSLTTPTIGVATATSVNKVAITAPATGSTLTIADGKTLTTNNTLTLAGTDSTTMTFPATSSTVLTTGNTATITKGFTVTPNNISTGSFTVDPTLGNYQYVTNNGAFTITNPASDCAVDILITNGASAGAITFTGFTVGSNTGSAFTTTNTNKFLLSVRRINGVSTYSNYALQ